MRDQFTQDFRARVLFFAMRITQDIIGIRVYEVKVIIGSIVKSRRCAVWQLIKKTGSLPCEGSAGGDVPLPGTPRSRSSPHCQRWRARRRLSASRCSTVVSPTLQAGSCRSWCCTCKRPCRLSGKNRGKFASVANRGKMPPPARQNSAPSRTPINSLNDRISEMPPLGRWGIGSHWFSGSAGIYYCTER